MGSTARLDRFTNPIQATKLDALLRSYPSPFSGSKTAPYPEAFMPQPVRSAFVDDWATLAKLYGVRLVALHIEQGRRIFAASR